MSHKRLCSIFLVLQPGLITTELDFHFISKKLSNMLRVKCPYSAVLCILPPWSKIIRNANEGKNFKGMYESNVKFPKECVGPAGSDQNTQDGRGTSIFCDNIFHHYKMKIFPVDYGLVVVGELVCLSDLESYTVGGIPLAGPTLAGMS